MIWFFFGGSFLGITLFLIAAQATGRTSDICSILAGALLALAAGRRYLIIAIAMLAGYALMLVAHLALSGLATLATSGTYGFDDVGSPRFYIENYLLFGIFWLLLGVPHRAFSYRLDQESAQCALVGLLTTVATILTGILLLMLHFGGGPLRRVDINALIAGIIFTVFLVMPAYRSAAETCWKHGIIGMFSPKRLVKCFGEGAQELNEALDKSYMESRGQKITTESDSNSHKPVPVQ